MGRNLKIPTNAQILTWPQETENPCLGQTHLAHIPRFFCRGWLISPAVAQRSEPLNASGIGPNPSLGMLLQDCYRT